jgi:AraC-like DNA-binding protein
VRAIEKAVARVIATMRDNLGEELTVADMARVAMFSKFHFTRIFQRVTGVSPGRFLSALRLQQAKRLLVSTSLNVADISIRVGYNSVGTFSARFSRSVGLSPTEYRRLGGFSSRVMVEAGAGQPIPAAGGVVSGKVFARPDLPPGPVFVGLFPSRIPEGRPVRCAVLDQPGTYRLDDVPPGLWYLLAQSAPLPESGQSPFPGEAESSVATHGPLDVRAHTHLDTADLYLAPVRPVDPPVLIALVDLRPGPGPVQPPAAMAA